jgi:hypothetical protein
VSEVFDDIDLSDSCKLAPATVYSLDIVPFSMLVMLGSVLID